MKDLLSRFKYVVTDEGCFNCTSHRARVNGYIKINEKVYGEGLLHRFVWKTYNQKDIPDKYVIMHLCDNRECINPEHLRLGTSSDNNYDCHNKGRSYAKKGLHQEHKNKLSESRKRAKYKCFCKICGSEFIAGAWNNKKCNLCRRNSYGKKNIKSLVSKEG